MKAIKLFSNLMFNLMVVLMLSVATDIGFGYLFAGGTIMAMLPQPQGIFGMAIQKEIWVNYIIGNLFKDNAFLNFAYNADEYVLQGKVVHIPQAGAKTSVQRNRTELPATVIKRSDTEISYVLDEYTTDPVLIPSADEKELSYDKKQSVLGEQEAGMHELMAEWIIYKWLPTTAARMLRTTGDAVVAHLPSATGNRKIFKLADLKKARAAMNKLNIPKADRYALMSTDMLEQLTDQLTENQLAMFQKAYDLATGVVGELFGFKIIERSTVARYSNAGTPVPIEPDADGAATDNDAVLCWQKNSVERAIGAVDFFENLGDATYYGDIYSASVRAGGRIRRTNAEGVVAIIQASAA